MPWEIGAPVSASHAARKSPPPTSSAVAAQRVARALLAPVAQRVARVPQAGGRGEPRRPGVARGDVHGDDHQDAVRRRSSSRRGAGSTISPSMFAAACGASIVTRRPRACGTSGCSARSPRRSATARRTSPDARAVGDHGDVEQAVVVHGGVQPGSGAERARAGDDDLPRRTAPEHLVVHRHHRLERVAGDAGLQRARDVGARAERVLEVVGGLRGVGGEAEVRGVEERAARRRGRGRPRRAATPGRARARAPRPRRPAGRARRRSRSPSPPGSRRARAPQRGGGIRGGAERPVAAGDDDELGARPRAAAPASRRPPRRRCGRGRGSPGRSASGSGPDPDAVFTISGTRITVAYAPDRGVSNLATLSRVKVGIVGMPNAGKSSLFNALTKAGAEAANYPFTTIEPNVAVVPVVTSGSSRSRRSSARRRSSGTRSPSTTSPGSSPGRPRARASATSSWRTSARPTRSSTSCAPTTTRTSSTPRAASTRRATSTRSRPS